MRLKSINEYGFHYVVVDGLGKGALLRCYYTYEVGWGLSKCLLSTQSGHWLVPV